MVCQTVKAGVECIFMTERGCTYNGGRCYPIVEECQGCERVQEFPDGLYCQVYSEPRLKWLKGRCPMATHLKEEKARKEGKKLNPLKAAKRRIASL